MKNEFVSAYLIDVFYWKKNHKNDIEMVFLQCEPWYASSCWTNTSSPLDNMDNQNVEGQYEW